MRGRKEVMALVVAAFLSLGSTGGLMTAVDTYCSVREQAAGMRYGQGLSATSGSAAGEGQQGWRAYKCEWQCHACHATMPPQPQVVRINQDAELWTYRAAT
eukprot:1152809-Pelagomonas_calceolata.AAC.6